MLGTLYTHTHTHTLTHNTYKHTCKEEDGEWEEAVFQEIIVTYFPDLKTNT